MARSEAHAIVIPERKQIQMLKNQRGFAIVISSPSLEIDNLSDKASYQGMWVDFAITAGSFRYLSILRMF